MQRRTSIPYLYRKSVLVLFFLLGTLSLFGQVATASKQQKDTVFPKIDTLKAAIVTATLRPRMKGDTLEYNVENVLLRRNSAVEELLRRLPGLQIDAAGNITYNGENIQHLLVDGEDIFGSDPTLITRSFDASKISRVQILDRKSDQAIFTGIDDGTRTKTLNLVLKGSAKDGYFGKVQAGANTSGNYSANGALAAFRKKEQFAALGFASNTGAMGFTSNAGGDVFANISFLNGNTDPLAASAGAGIPKFQAVALHYSNNWEPSGEHVMANYQYSHYFTRPVTTTQTLEAQPNSSYIQHQESHSTNQQDQHWSYLTYDLNSKSVSSFRFVLHASNSEGTNRFGATGNSMFNDTLVNSSLRTIQDKVSRTNVGGEAYWRTKFGNRADQQLSVGVNMGKIDVSTTGQLYSLNQFYQPNGTIQMNDTIDQRKQIASHSLNLGSSINYIQPLWKGTTLGISYWLSYTEDDPLQGTFNRGDGKYQVMVDSLSSHFQTQTVTQNGLINLQGKWEGLSYTIGNSWTNFSYRQQDLLDDSLLHLRYLNWMPRALFNYTLNSSTNVRFEYSSSTQQPSIAQLQPSKNNSDPLHLTLGNPGLLPGFTQTFKLDYHRFKTWLVNIGANFALSNNSISTKTITDSLGRQITQPINVEGGKTGGINFFVGRKILGIDMALHFNSTYTRAVNFINADLNRSDIYVAGSGIDLNKYVPDKYSLHFSTSFSYFDQMSSINTNAPVHYWTQSQSGAVTLFLIRNYEVNTSANYTWQEKTSVFSVNTSVLLLNAYVGRNFLEDRLTARASITNILSQNSGISRSNLNNINTETSTNILGRYWMLSFIYHFDKKFKHK